MTMIFAGLLVSTLAGFLLVRSIWRGPVLQWEREDWLRLPLGAFIGLGLTSIPAFLSNRPPMQADLALLAAAAILFAIFGRGERAAVSEASSEANRDRLGDPQMVPGTLDADPVVRGSSKEAPVWRPALWCGITLIVISAAAFFLLLRSNPHGDFDAWRIWNLRARLLFLGQPLSMLAEPRLGWTLPAAPYLLTSSVLRLWRWHGDDTQAAPMAIAALFAIFVPMAVYGFLRLVRTHGQAWVGLAAMLGSAGFLATAAIEVADVPLAAYVFGAAAAILCTERLQKPQLAVLAGLCGGLAAWMKFEGLFYVGALAGIALWRLKSAGFVRFLIGAVPGIAITAYFLTSVAPPVQNAVSANPIMLAIAIAMRLFTFSLMGWAVTPLVVFALYAYFVRFSPGAPNWIRIWMPVLALFAAGTIAIMVRDDNPGDSAAIRLIIHVWPFAVATLFVHTKTPEELMVEAVPQIRKGKSKK